jgi:hypothetical protein
MRSTGADEGRPVFFVLGVYSHLSVAFADCAHLSRFIVTQINNYFYTWTLMCLITILNLDINIHHPLEQPSIQNPFRILYRRR